MPRRTPPRPCPRVQVQLIPRLEEASPLSLIKALLFLSKLGPGHAEVFERVRHTGLTVLKTAAAAVLSGRGASVWDDGTAL